VLLLYAESAANQTLSYQVGWPKHFRRHPRFDCVPLNVAERGVAGAARAQWTIRTSRFDGVVVLHSAFSNALCVPPRVVDAIAALPQPKAYFIGNEFKLMPEKMAFCDRLNVALLVTMIPDARAQAMYRKRLGCAVISIPSAGLDTDIFFATTARDARPIDLGYRSFAAPMYLGHDERRRIAHHFTACAAQYGLAIDISLDAGERFTETAWAAFLNRCKGQLGTEAGGDYFELSDDTRSRASAFLERHPDAEVDEVFERFFRDYADPIPARTISGRHVEAAATKTVQLLFEGGYSGFLQPDEDYIPLKKDFSNVDTALAKFRDAAYCEHLVERAHAVVRQQLTYDVLIDTFYAAFNPLIP
jgi:hypothetical protein